MKIALILPQIVSPQQRMLAMGLRLEAAGHEVVIFAPENGLPLARHLDFDAEDIPDPQINTFSPVLPRPQGLRTPRAFRQRAEAGARTMGVADLPERLAAHAPDLVLCNAELPAHAIVARGAGFRVALVTSMFLTPPGLQAPPLHFAQTPGQGWRGSKPAVAAAWAYYLARKSALVTRNALRDWGADHPAVLRQIAREAGVRPKRRFWGWQMPFSLALPTLVMLPQALNLPVAPYPGQQFIGPMILRSRPKQPFDPGVLDRFAKGKLRIMMAFGTLVRPGNTLINAVLQAAKEKPDWEVLGLLRHAGEVTETPPNVTLVPWAPQRKVLAQADIAIIHGGAASVLECIEAEVPMLVYPKATDQCGNAARVVFHGLGREGRAIDTAADVAAHIAALRADPELPTRLARMKDAAEAETRAGVLEMMVETLGGREG